MPLKEDARRSDTGCFISGKLDDCARFFIRPGPVQQEEMSAQGLSRSESVQNGFVQAQAFGRMAGDERAVGQNS